MELVAQLEQISAASLTAVLIVAAAGLLMGVAPSSLPMYSVVVGSVAAAVATDLVKLVPRFAPVGPRIERASGVLVLLAAAYFFYLSAFYAGLAPAIDWLLLR